MIVLLMIYDSESRFYNLYVYLINILEINSPLQHFRRAKASFKYAKWKHFGIF